jgi:hypothetical protein
VLTKYEKKISSAETLLEVFEVMKEMFEELMAGVAKHNKCENFLLITISDFLDCSDISVDPKNDNVELIMQKYEADIRAHVKMQKEMQKLAEALQVKLEDSENVGQIGEQKFLDLERRHYGLLGDLNSVKEENRKLKVLLEEIDKYVSAIFCLGLLT